jgi:tetratricopeptide (TPR) repeat protein
MTQTAAAVKSNTDGLLEFKNDKYEAAIKDFTQAIQVKPDYADAYLNRARAYERLRLQETALSDLDRVIQMNPTSTEAYFERGQVLLELNQADKAIADFTSAINLKSDYWEAYASRGATFLRKSSFDWAISDYSRVIASGPDSLKPSAYIGRGLAYKWMKDRDRAIADLLKVMETSFDLDERSQATTTLKGLNYVDNTPRTQVPSTFNVFLLYSDEKDKPAVEQIATVVRNNGISVKTASGSNDPFIEQHLLLYYSQSVQAETLANKLREMIVKALSSQPGNNSSELTVRYGALDDPFVPRGNIEVYFSTYLNRPATANPFK